MALEATTGAQVNPNNSFTLYTGEEEPHHSQRGKKGEPGIYPHRRKGPTHPCSIGTAVTAVPGTTPGLTRATAKSRASVH